MFYKALRSISLLMARIGGGILVATALVVSVEVILRKTGIVTFSVGTELSSYALAIGGTWAFAFVVFERGHVRIDIVSQRLPDWPRAVLNVLATASLAVVGAYLTWSAFSTFRESLRLSATANTTLATPLAIPQGLWAFGLGWFTFVAIYMTAIVLGALMRGDLAKIERSASPAAAAEEADEAAAEARQRLVR